MYKEKNNMIYKVQLDNNKSKHNNKIYNLF